jgi:hypothetical protein
LPPSRAEYCLNRMPRVTAMSPSPYAVALVSISSASAIKPLDWAQRPAAMPTTNMVAFNPNAIRSVFRSFSVFADAWLQSQDIVSSPVP